MTLVLIVRYWREGVMGVLALVLVAMLALHTHDRGLLRECKAARLADQQAVRTVTAQAQADDIAHARTVETRNANVSQETERDLQGQLTDARAAAAHYAAGLRRASAANPGGGGTAGVPATADTPGGVADANRASLLDADLRICSENTVKAAGWQAWWPRVSVPVPSTEP